MQPSNENLRRSHTDENLRSYPSDGAEALGIIVAVIILVALQYPPLAIQLPVAIVGVVSLVVSIGAWFKKRLTRHRTWRDR
jgi:hypothetical protein